MKWKWYASGIVLCLLLSSTVLAQPGDKSAEIDQLFATWNRKDSPGCVVLVRQDVYELTCTIVGGGKGQVWEDDADEGLIKKRS